MKKTFNILFVLSFTLLLTACYSNSSPTDTVASAGNAIRKGDFEDFSKLVTGNAKRAYANSRGFASLQQRFRKYGKFQLGKPDLISRSHSDSDNDLAKYSVAIFGDGKRIATALVACVDGLRPGPQRCEERDFGGDVCFPTEIETRECAIYELR